MKGSKVKNKAAETDEEEDDYMTMTVAEPETQNESSIRRAWRLKQESLARGRIKSKETLAREAEEQREEALNKSLLDDPRAKESKGLAMMAKMGFTGGTLGKKSEGGTAGSRQAEPIKLKIKNDTFGIGHGSEKRAREADQAPVAQQPAPKAAKIDMEAYRQRISKERQEMKYLKDLMAAQKAALSLDDKKLVCSDPSLLSADISSRPSKSLPVEYRGLLRQKTRGVLKEDEEGQQVLDPTRERMPEYAEDEMDADDKLALGDAAQVPLPIEVKEEEDDDELAAFNALPVTERLAKVLDYLRRKHRYCYWCKESFPDDTMDGCPGLEEEDHD